VHCVGDLMVDATVQATEMAKGRSEILAKLGLLPRSYAVATVHRAENTDDPSRLARVLDFIALQARQQPTVMPLHPRTAAAVLAAGLSLQRPGLIVTEPLGYLDMCMLTHHAELVLTDSGGLQKEAYFHRVPCVTLRDETEWTETVECGWNRLWQAPDYRPRREIPDFVQGAAGNIVRILEEQFRPAS